MQCRLVTVACRKFVHTPGLVQNRRRPPLGKMIGRLVACPMPVIEMPQVSPYGLALPGLLESLNRTLRCAAGDGTALFRGTIRENIAYGRPDPEDACVASIPIGIDSTQPEHSGLPTSSGIWLCFRTSG
jgi:hypothetical protein